MIKITVDYDYEILGLQCTGQSVVEAKSLDEVIVKTVEYVDAIIKEDEVAIMKSLGVKKETIEKVEKIVKDWK